MRLDSNPKSIAGILFAVGLLGIGLVLTFGFFDDAALLGVGLAMIVFGALGLLLGVIHICAKDNSGRKIKKEEGEIAPKRVPKEVPYLNNRDKAERDLEDEEEMDMGGMYYEPCSVSPNRGERGMGAPGMGFASPDRDGALVVPNGNLVLSPYEKKSFPVPNMNAAAGGRTPNKLVVDQYTLGGGGDRSSPMNGGQPPVLPQHEAAGDIPPHDQSGMYSPTHHHHNNSGINNSNNSGGASSAFGAGTFKKLQPQLEVPQQQQQQSYASASSGNGFGMGGAVGGGRQPSVASMQSSSAAGGFRAGSQQQQQQQGGGGSSSRPMTTQQTSDTTVTSTANALGDGRTSVTGQASYRTASQQAIYDQEQRQQHLVSNATSASYHEPGSPSNAFLGRNNSNSRQSSIQPQPSQFADPTNNKGPLRPLPAAGSSGVGAGTAATASYSNGRRFTDGMSPPVKQVHYADDFPDENQYPQTVSSQPYNSHSQYNSTANRMGSVGQYSNSTFGGPGQQQHQLMGDEDAFSPNSQQQRWSP